MALPFEASVLLQTLPVRMVSPSENRTKFGIGREGIRQLSEVSLC